MLFHDMGHTFSAEAVSSFVCYGKALIKYGFSLITVAKVNAKLVVFPIDAQLNIAFAAVAKGQGIRQLGFYNKHDVCLFCLGCERGQNQVYGLILTKAGGVMESMSAWAVCRYPTISFICPFDAIPCKRAR